MTQFLGWAGLVLSDDLHCRHRTRRDGCYLVADSLGAPYALGAMHACDPTVLKPLERAQVGMAAAMRFSNGVGGRVDVMQVQERAA